MSVSLEPYVAQLRLRSATANDAAYWRAFMRRLLAAVAQGAVAAGAALIGHIKALAEVDGIPLRANCVSAKEEPDVEFALTSRRDSLDVDLVVLVYGLGWGAVHDIVAAALEASGAELACTVGLDPRRPQGAPPAHGASPSAKRHAKLISCKVMIEEIRPYLPATVATEEFDISLHTHPNALRSKLQQAIDAADGVFDPILLGYGMCSKATVGLVAQRSRLVVPKSDDCIGIFLGSERQRRALTSEEPGTYFLTQGWIGSGLTGPLAEFERMVEKFGRQRAEALLAKMMRHYKRLAYIRMPMVASLAADREAAQAMALRFGMEYVEIEGNPRWLQNLADHTWGEDFVVAEPGQPLALEQFM